MKPFDPERRDFLKKSALTAGSALVLGIAWSGKIAAANDDSPRFKPNAWLKIDTDGVVTLYIAESEMGQGPFTSLSMLIAEELEVDWQKVQVEHAPLDPAYGFQGTGGSRSVRRNWKTLREAGAVARQMLLAAGAEYLKAPVDSCQAQHSRITHRPSSKSVSYAAVVGRAAEMPIPKNVKLKQPEDYRLIGTPVTRLDLTDKLNGKVRYGIDIKLPDMVYATIAQSPVFGGSVKSFNGAEIKQRSGIIDCFELEEGVVVVAQGTWQAFEARKALKIEWQEGKTAQLNSDNIIQRLSGESSEKPSLILQRGEPIAQLGSALNAITSEYQLPFQAHMTPEPMNCTVGIEDGQYRIWAPTQSPTSAMATAVKALKPLMPQVSEAELEARIEIVTPLLGGGFGRRIKQDYVTQAVKIAHRIKRSVQLIWPREEDVQHDHYHPLTQHRLSGRLDEAGNPQAWYHLITGLQSGKYGADSLAYDIPHVRVELLRLNSPVPIGPWRSVSNHYNAYAIEHFFDELARAGGQSPLELRLKLLMEPRLRAVLQRAAEAASWHRQDQQRRLGCAVHSSFGSHVAEIVELIRQDEHTLKLGKITCVVDCGIAINPDTIKAQLEGSVIYALGAALKPPIMLKNGRVEQHNFHDTPILSFKETPPIEVIISNSRLDPGGVGEPGVPPLAPALANALLSAHGKPVTRMPMKLNGAS
ncbi:MAG: molybdopterin-dependent oxidoreductase [Candidatus Thiodiazotropha lotti]|uniref:Aldehyde oxidase/xanthine dehydrogenase a/b hammerhead domain-containing protein n=1 Tax=Candidatus Thiodiazotropha endoloripes TaxID=1818881 RepID=A0A1E2URR9_9GAMM|nr:molybdopterin cofactor-binding domain-containing protein [Candidatus Thiodiazotropha endoloripes]MCG7898447.1 molybdopterin-dependent oxidoreductase [Candidatus Thiodiazotropha weberae]MCG7990310.1 molybdopterin-dependent oxidoreductase [Candidatus Thiodiazotropha lotti]MCG7999053.1 molybdopterin-dependent oxidoreductase [Candidatus Thiodiazotropha lotti]MCW4181964.1 molybdopterin-dependent oxidoreductase [Candidatus Thiodiazotropha weberae]MCW4190821.1 molybdopterin-dependent oxidoreductas